jgi:hypothetical protein
MIASFLLLAVLWSCPAVRIIAENRCPLPVNVLSNVNEFVAQFAPSINFHCRSCEL